MRWNYISSPWIGMNSWFAHNQEGGRKVIKIPPCSLEDSFWSSVSSCKKSDCTEATMLWGSLANWQNQYVRCLPNSPSWAPNWQHNHETYWVEITSRRFQPSTAEATPASKSSQQRPQTLQNNSKTSLLCPVWITDPQNLWAKENINFFMSLKF